jgi:hypothetical protein
MPPHRTLTDADVEAIATALQKCIKEEFYSDLGKGFWSILWKGIMAALIMVAAYGAGRGIAKP